MVVFHNFLLRPLTVGVDKPPSKSFDGGLSNDILSWQSPFYNRLSLLLYLVIVSGMVAD
jgi:hypothetical protein